MAPKFSQKVWKLVKSMIDSGISAVDVASKFKGMTPQQIYYRKKKWKAQEYYSTKNLKYHTKKYKAWRLAVFTRDGFKCRWCGKNRHLQADHILPQSTHPHLKYEISNGRTLCRTCHKRTATYGTQALNYKNYKK